MKALTIFIDEGICLLKTLKMEHFWLIRKIWQWSFFKKNNKPVVSRPSSPQELTSERAKLSRQPGQSDSINML